jgi:hypothetical protein
LSLASVFESLPSKFVTGRNSSRRSEQFFSD